MFAQMITPGIIDHKAENEIISQRITDGYVNATAMCKAAGKQINDYIRLKTTAEYMAELSAETGILVSEIVITNKGGNVKLQGTWIHPQAAISLAQWLSPKFAVLVTQWVAEWMSGTPRSSNI